MSGTLILLVGPSGSGKGTLMSYIRAHYAGLVYPTSWTTRAPRAGESDGVYSGAGKVYHFVSEEEFVAAKEHGEFLEWDHHFNNYYGTPAKEVHEGLAAGHVVFQELEVHGVKQLLEKLPRAQIKIIFVTAGSWSELSRRILSREVVSNDELEKRRLRYEEEVLFAEEADFVLLNEDGKLEQTQHKLDEIMREIMAAK